MGCSHRLLAGGASALAISLCLGVAPQALANVITVYDGGGGRLRTATEGEPDGARSDLLAPLDLAPEEKEALEAFLKTL